MAADYYVVKSSELSELKDKIKMALEGCQEPTYPFPMEGFGSGTHADSPDKAMVD